MSELEPEEPQRALASPRGLAITAVLLAALFAGAHALGLRPYAAILSGTAPPGASGPEALVLGLVYVALYFACVIGSPILAIAAGVMWGIERARR